MTGRVVWVKRAAACGLLTFDVHCDCGWRAVNVTRDEGAKAVVLHHGDGCDWPAGGSEEDG